MTITFQTPGATAVSAQNGTSVSPAYPAGSVEGNKLILLIGMKPSTANSGSVTTPTNWNPVTSLTGAGGYGATLGADTGNTNLFVFERTVPVGGLSGSLAVTVATNNVCWAVMLRLSKTVGNEWGTVAGTTGSDTTAGSVSITFAANPGVTAGDYVIGAMCIPTDVTTPAQFTVEAFTQTGVTFGTVTETTELDSGTGNDIGGFICSAPVSSGTGSAAPVMTATAGGTTTNVRGPGVFIRVRELVATTLTGGNSEQANESSSGAISQTHVTTGANSEQGNESSAGAIVQTHVLTGANSEQDNLSSSGSIQVSMPVGLTGGNSEQANESSPGALIQTHLLTGANSEQANETSPGAISSTHVLTGANSEQDNESSSGAITLTVTLTGANSEQSNESSPGSISQTHVLTGANSEQVNQSSAGSVTFGVDLTGANSEQSNESSAGAITQTHILWGNYVQQGYVETGYVLSSDVQQLNQSSEGSLLLPGNGASGINRQWAAYLQQLDFERLEESLKEAEPPLPLEPKKLKTAKKPVKAQLPRPKAVKPRPPAPVVTQPEYPELELDYQEFYKLLSAPQEIYAELNQVQALQREKVELEEDEDEAALVLLLSL